MSNYPHTWIDTDDGFDVCTVCNATSFHGVAYDREDDIDSRVIRDED